MLEPGRASFEGDYAEVRGAINEPKGLQQPRIPIVVGGNGRNVTFRYAARFAEELNLVFLVPDEVAELLPIVRQRCEEEDATPATLRVSLYTRDQDVREPGQERVDFLGALAALGLDRVVCFRRAGTPRPRRRPSSRRTAWRPDSASTPDGAEIAAKYQPGVIEGRDLGRFQRPSRPIHWPNMHPR